MTTKSRTQIKEEMRQKAQEEMLLPITAPPGWNMPEPHTQSGETIAMARALGKALFDHKGGFAMRGICIAIADQYRTEDLEYYIASTQQAVRNAFAEVLAERQTKVARVE